MFKVVTTPTYSATVSVEVRGENGGIARQSFDAVFKRCTQTELEDLHQAVTSGKLSDQDLVREILVGWKGVVDEDGSEMPFTPASRDRVLDIYPVRPSVIDTFFKTIGGARAKN